MLYISIAEIKLVDKKVEGLKITEKTSKCTPAINYDDIVAFEVLKCVLVKALSLVVIGFLHVSCTLHLHYVPHQSS